MSNHLYDPEITFDANARAVLARSPTFRESDVAQMLRDAYEDGWLDARAGQLAGIEISECPGKWQ
jgi:hypothetical protein